MLHTTLLAVLGMLAILAAAQPAAAEPRHGLSVFGELKYPADFAHYDFVNPNAPKGGRFRLVGSSAVTTFNTFNPHILKGDKAQGLSLLFDSLMERSPDEPDAVYGLVAHSAEVAADRMSVTFKMRPEARFSDGSALTSADVVFTFETLKQKGHPGIRQVLADVTGVEALDGGSVRYSFRGGLVRDLPMVVATLPILSKAYYATRNFEETTLEPPLGSGPYLIGDHQQGKFVSYKRRADYWAKDLPINRGRYNFDEVRYEYFAERSLALEALKGGEFDFREEFTARDWATAYDVPAVSEKRLLRVTLPDERPSGAQGFFINMRKAKFKDARVRRALDYAFNFEWASKHLFYGQYKRSASMFENSDMKARSKPGADELALLEPLRDKLPAAVFEEAYVPPASDGNEFDRGLLLAASKLLEEAGWAVKGSKRVNAQGEVLGVEFLYSDPTTERILGNYVKNLTALGIDASLRRVDPAQYERRMKSFDFDIASRRYVMSLTPGPELRILFGSEAAATEGSPNISGVADPAIDRLIEHAVNAKSRKELDTAMRALDRVLRATHFMVPQWFKASHTVAYWDKFSRPGKKPKYALGELDTWWFDPEKAAKLKPN
ncbi:MAG: extracellular solute-binding protein [Hyphomicrobiaceae bacterium]|nr:extracellular solute-binding protein [Hyphomicrobiaceae bacterium]